MSMFDADDSSSGKIWFPPKGGGGIDDDDDGGDDGDVVVVELTLPYGFALSIGFQDTCYFSASNQHSFQPILPVGNFVANTSIGPYFAAPLNSHVLLTSYDESTHVTYQYDITIEPPPPPDEE